MTKAQREILKRSEAAGGVSSTDYELAWSHYKQCVVDKGYSTPVLDRYPNGLYFVARINAEGMRPTNNETNSTKTMAFVSTRK